MVYDLSRIVTLLTVFGTVVFTCIRIYYAQHYTYALIQVVAERLRAKPRDGRPRFTNDDFLLTYSRTLRPRR